LLSKRNELQRIPPNRVTAGFLSSLSAEPATGDHF